MHIHNDVLATFLDFESILRRRVAKILSTAVFMIITVMMKGEGVNINKKTEIYNIFNSLQYFK